MRIPVLLAAQSVVRDAETNQMSIFNVLEMITPAGYPFVIQAMTLFALIERDVVEPNMQHVEFALQLNDEVVLSMPITIEFANTLRNRSVLHVNGLAITAPGQLRVLARVGDDVKATYCVDLAPANPAVGPPDTSLASSETQIN